MTVVVFEEGDPARAGRIVVAEPAGSARLRVCTGDGLSTLAVTPHPVPEALPLLLSGAVPGRAGEFWAAAARRALHLVARGRVLPGVSPAGFDTWRIGTLDESDVAAIDDLAAAMPPEARAVPVVDRPPSGPPELPDAAGLVRAFLDAVADVLPRSPGAALVTGGGPFASLDPHPVPGLREWAGEVATGVRLTLRLELTGPGPAVVAVVEVNRLAGGTRPADAADGWAGTVPWFGVPERLATALAVRRAASVWPPLEPLLHAAVPDRVALGDDDVVELLSGRTAALESAGVTVRWPPELDRGLTTRVVIGGDEPPPTGTAPGGPGRGSGGEPAGTGEPGGPAFRGDGSTSLHWQLALRGQALSPAELEHLAAAHRPIVRLRDRWLLVDPAMAGRAREPALKSVPAIRALGATLAGTVTVDGTDVDVAPGGALEWLRKALSTSGGEPERQPAALAADLRTYQLHGLRWLARLHALGLGGCLADDMGLGKTITVIALHLHRAGSGAAGPTLVVCPASLLGNWEREIRRFAPGVEVRRFHGGGRALAGADEGFVLTTYGTLRVDADVLAGHRWGLLVADEAQHVKNALSHTAKALRVVGRDQRPAPARVALTGTPVENNLGDLWAILDWTTPGLLGSRAGFRDRWARPVEADPGGSAADRLARLVRPFLLRRRKSDPGIAPELPAKTETDQPAALTDEQIGLYEALVRESMQRIRDSDGMARRGLILKLLTGLKQICNHPAQFRKEPDAPLAGRSGKLELLDELVDTITAAGQATLVFTQYVAMGRLIERHLASRGVTVRFLHGGTGVRQRDDLVDRFQRGEVPVFLLSLKAAGTGLNLTRAGHVIHYDRWWNPAVEDQATDRAYRIGQTQPVQVHRLIAEGTLEDRIAELLESKRELADAVLDGGEAAFTDLSDADLTDLIEFRGNR